MAGEREHYLAPTGFRISDGTAHVLMRAEAIARETHSTVVGTDHLLLGCIERFEPFFRRYQVSAQSAAGLLMARAEHDVVGPQEPPAGKLALAVLTRAEEYAAVSQDILRPEYLVLSLLERQQETIQMSVPLNLFDIARGVPLDMLELFMRESLRRQP